MFGMLLFPKDSHETWVLKLKYIWIVGVFGAACIGPKFTVILLQLWSNGQLYFYIGLVSHFLVTSNFYILHLYCTWYAHEDVYWLFACSENKDNDEYDEYQKYFRNIIDAFINMLVLLTTANNPDGKTYQVEVERVLL